MCIEQQQIDIYNIEYIKASISPLLTPLKGGWALKLLSVKSNGTNTKKKNLKLKKKILNLK